jgi:hypothetical protein
MNRSRYDRGTKAGKTTMRFSETPGRSTPVLTNDPEYRRMHYARYAHDFIIGITGPRGLAVRVKMLVARFLKQRLRLQLNEDKTAITQIGKSDVSFLGYSIRRGQSFAMRHTQHFGNYTRPKFRCRIGGITLLADVDKVVQGLAYKGFCKGRYPVPNFRYMHLTQSYTITRVNSILRGLNEYYRLSENKRAAVRRFSYLIRYSLAKMFAAKYKLRSVSYVFKRAGKDLGKPLSKGDSTCFHRAIYKNDPLVKDALTAGYVKGTRPKLLYTKYRDIQKPDLSPLAKQWDPWKNVEQPLDTFL